jgi:predicted O-methyltransferase YrrM
VIGVDVDEVALAGARANFARLGAGGVETWLAAGREALDRLPGPIDLLYLDAEEPGRGKAIYLDLLDIAYPKLRPGALVLAHDISVPKFRADLSAYLARARDRSRFAATACLEIDPCGLAITRR